MLNKGKLVKSKYSQRIASSHSSQLLLNCREFPGGSFHLTTKNQNAQLERNGKKQEVNKPVPMFLVMYKMCILNNSSRFYLTFLPLDMPQLLQPIVNLVQGFQLLSSGTGKISEKTPEITLARVLSE